MANKDKLLANAQKFLSKGQIPKAIGEYKKLVEAAPKDVRNRQKLAELLGRDKRSEEALTEYEVVAKHYTETGFYLKSIAVFKQMQKIDPSRVDIYHRLAELNEKQGLVGNALTEYRNLVSFYDKNEMHNEAIEVLEKMAELDPDNLNFAAKIAENLMASGRNEEAFEKFQLIITPISEKGEHLKVVKLYERFLDICPEEGTSRLPLAQALLNSGSPDKAVKILKGLLKHTPEDPDINKSLTDAYVANQDFANARLTLKHLLKQKGDDLELREYYVRVCIDAGESERARDRLEEWKDAFFQAERVTVLQGFYEELKELLPDDPTVPETLSVIYEAVGDTAKLDKLDVRTEATAEKAEADVTADVALVDGAIDDVETLDMVGEEAASDMELPPLDAGEPEQKQSAEKTAASGIELDLDLDLDLEPPGAPVEDETPSVEAEATTAEVKAPAPEAVEDVDIEIEIDLDDMGDLDLDFEEEIAVEKEEPAAEQASAEVAESEAVEETIAEDGEQEPELELEIAPETLVLDEAEEVISEESVSADLELSLDALDLDLAGVDET
ncbi:MAG: tetratricopeptide repeat protein, partial [Desulfuromonadales bacterium]|nr:tetratricopeptide repeat protein [Desulfuromonadales bacterium]